MRTRCLAYRECNRRFTISPCAKQTIRLIGDPDAISEAYDFLAWNQAKAGLYDEADVSLDKFVRNTGLGPAEKKDMRELIGGATGPAAPRIPCRAEAGIDFEEWRLHELRLCRR